MRSIKPRDQSVAITTQSGRATATKLFYVTASTNPIVSVPFTTRPTVGFGTPVELTRAPRPGLPSWQPRGYDVLPDGRFVSVLIAPGPAEVRVVLNWIEELKRLVPTK